MALYAAAAALGFSLTETGVMVTTQLATLEHGHLRVPHQLTHALVEIGASDLDTLDEQVLPSDPHAFLLTFEPMADKYAKLMARGDHRFGHNGIFISGGSNLATPLGFYHPQAVALPVAVSLTSGPVTMNIGRVAGCPYVPFLNHSHSPSDHCLPRSTAAASPQSLAQHALWSTVWTTRGHFYIDVDGVQGDGLLQSALFVAMCLRCIPLTPS